MSTKKYGWKGCRLADLCEINIGKTPSRNETRYWGGANPWLAISDMKGDECVSRTKERISDAAVEECNCKIVSAGTVLLSFKLSIGKVAISGVPIYTNEAIAALPIKNGTLLDAKYLYWSLQVIDLMQGTDRAVMGKTLNKAKLADLQIPLPPLEEQKRIAAILDKADAIRRKRQQALQLADDFLRATFLDMFGDPVTNPKGWPMGTIRDLVSEAKYGTSAKADVQNGQFPILRMGNLTYEGRIDTSDLKYIDLPEHEHSKYLVSADDILFNRTNSKELVGKTAVFDRDEQYAFAGYLVRMRANDLADPYYISGYLNSNHGKATLRGMCKNIVGMANINAQEVQEIRITIPPIELQQEYRRIVDKVRLLGVKLSTDLEACDQLFSSLSQRAFRGDL